MQHDLGLSVRPCHLWASKQALNPTLSVSKQSDHELFGTH